MDQLLKEAGLETTDIAGKIDEVATLENAKHYARESEKFIFCIDLLEMSAHDLNADYAVNKLEDRFEALLRDDQGSGGD